MLYYYDDIVTMFDSKHYFNKEPTYALSAFNSLKTNNRFVSLDYCYGEIAILSDSQFEDFKVYYRDALEKHSVDPTFDVVFVVAIHFKLEDNKNLVGVFLADGKFHNVLANYCDDNGIKSQFVDRDFLDTGVYDSDSVDSEIAEEFLEVMNYDRKF